MRVGGGKRNSLMMFSDLGCRKKRGKGFRLPTNVAFESSEGSSLVEVKYKPIKCLARRAGGARSEQNS